MTLTTPVSTDFDTAFPGENWFFYWKITSSLWEEKISNYAKDKILIVPINWSMHSETGDTYDFADKRPETDLLKIQEICEKQGIDCHFFIPISPVPYLQNGGIPYLLARSYSKTKEQMIFSVVDNEGNINKIFSFYDPRVYQAFRGFLNSLSNYFKLSGKVVKVWGFEGVRMRNDRFESFLEDFSPSFEKGFAKFLAMKSKEEISKRGKSSLYKEFYLTIKDLYQSALSDFFEESLEGLIRINFLGTSKVNLGDSFAENVSITNVFDELSNSLKNEITPSSVMIDQNKKSGLLECVLNNIVNSVLVPNMLNQNNLEDSGFGYRKLQLVTLFEENNFITNESVWKKIGLTEFVEEELKVPTVFQEIEQLKFDEFSQVEGNLFFALGEELDQARFQKVLKVFMNGGNVILHKDGMDKALGQRLSQFILENQLKEELVNFEGVRITCIHLSDGQMIVLESPDPDKFENLNKSKFWKKILEIFTIKTIGISNEAGVEGVWTTREPASFELKFDEIRRLHIYNRSSYKKSIQLSLGQKFVLTKFVDELNVTTKHGPSSVDVAFMPGGYVGIDFGVLG